MTAVCELTVRRDDLAAVSEGQPVLEPGPGQVLVAVEHFALTANNVTYAVHGDDFGYWRFWPASPGQGIVPVWGFGRIVGAEVPDIAVGTRLYGYWPMASHALLTPGSVTRRGFDDMAGHRQGLAPVYNRYVQSSDDWGPEPLQALFRPLYATSFVLDAMLQEHDVDTILLSSASSKTALGLAQLARGRQRAIGLTSPGNRGFCHDSGYFDQVLSYEQIGQITGQRIAFVDFSGNGDVRRAVHNILGERLVESHVVGDTHWQAPNLPDLPGVVPQLFFAPTIIAERVAEWGATGYEMRLMAAWRRFAGTLGWLRLVEERGPAAVTRHWQALLAGRVDPAHGLVLGLSGHSRPSHARAL